MINVSNLLWFRTVAVGIVIATGGAPLAVSAADSFVIKGRCHMGGCGFTEVVATKEIRSNSIGSLIEVSGRGEYVEAPLVDDEPQWDKIKVPKFRGEIGKSWVFCSTKTPATISFDDESKNFYVDMLSPGNPKAIFGYNTSSHLYYWGICHGELIDETALYDDSLNGKAAAMGYRKLPEDRLGQFKFRTLNQVYNFLGL
jgi:hypothetical protein